MHADTAMSARGVFHPAGVEAVIGFELAPVGHGSSFEAPTRGFVAQVALTNLAAVMSVAVAIGAVVVIFVENPEVAFGGGGARCSHGNGHDKQGFGAFHDVDHLVPSGYFYPDIGAVFW